MMPFAFRGRNTNDLACPVYSGLLAHGITDQSRNGPVLRFPAPAIFTYEHPWERVNFCPVRDANPFFHFFEALAMLAGHNNAPWLGWFLPRMLEFSDDGERFHGFYGSRLRVDYEDQLVQIISRLGRNRNDRQLVAQIYEAGDLWHGGKDIPCNTSLMFSHQYGMLSMTVTNRSNDLVWGGVTGANPVHMSMFHEYVALGAGIQQGPMYMVSNNAHVYSNDQWSKLAGYYDTVPGDPTHYWYEQCNQDDDLVPLFRGPLNRGAFDHDLDEFISLTTEHAAPLNQTYFHTTFFRRVAVPMYNAFWCRKNDPDAVRGWLESIVARDWQRACYAWVARREQREAAA